MSDEKSEVEKALYRAGEGEDPWPDEPDEFDPYSLGPGSTDPGLAAEGEAYEVDADTFRSFYGAVALANVGLFGVTVGPMLWYFRGAALVGGGMFLVGVVALVRTYRIQQQYQQRRREREAAADADEAPDT